MKCNSPFAVSPAAYVQSSCLLNLLPGEYVRFKIWMLLMPIEGSLVKSLYGSLPRRPMAYPRSCLKLSHARKHVHRGDVGGGKS